MRSFIGFSALFILLPLSNSLVQSAPQKMKAAEKAHSHAPGEAPVKGKVVKGKVAKKETPLDALWRKSDAAFHAGNYPLAIGFHRKIVALDPGEVESYSVAAWLLWSLGKPDEALQFIQKGLKANPKNPEMWDAAGQHYNLQKRAFDAEIAFGKAIGFTPKGKVDMMLRRRFAHAAQDAGHLAKSIGIWRALARDFPKNDVNKNNLARVQKAAQPSGDNARSAAFPQIGLKFRC